MQARAFTRKASGTRLNLGQKGSPLPFARRTRRLNGSVPRMLPHNTGLVLQQVCHGKESRETSIDVEGCLDSAAIRVKYSRS